MVNVASRDPKTFPVNRYVRIREEDVQPDAIVSDIPKE